MKVEQNPFSLYDFLGYFVPGSILACSFYYFLNFNNYDNLSTYIIATKFGGLDSYFPFIILSYALGQAQSFLSSYTIERFCIWHYSYPFRFLMGYSHDGYLNKKKHSFFTKVKRIVMFILLFPISIWDIFIDVIFKVKYLQNRKFSNEIKDLLSIRFKILVNSISDSKLEIDISKQDNFLLIYHYTLEQSKNHLSKFNNYVALYGFSRSMSFIFVLNFWTLIVYQVFINKNFSHQTIFITFSLSLFSYIFYLSYCKFLRRFSLEVIMAFITTPTNSSHTKS